MTLDSVIFYTNNFQQSMDFYTQVLGLEIVYLREGEFVSYLFRNGAKLGVKAVKEEREVPGHQTMVLGVGDIEAMFQSMKHADVDFYKELTHESWGTEFSIIDPDSNKVIFHELKTA